MMSYTFDEHDHRDFEPSSGESQKLKGVIELNTSVEITDSLPLDLEPKMKKKIIHKVKQKIETGKDEPGKLF